jgi:hypothetical protein
MVADTIEGGSHLWAKNPDRPDPSKQLTNDRGDFWPSVARTGRTLFHRQQGSFVEALGDSDLYVGSWNQERFAEGRTAAIVKAARGQLSDDGRRALFARGEFDDELWLGELDAVTAASRVSTGFYLTPYEPETLELSGQTAAWAPQGSDRLYFGRKSPTVRGAYELAQADVRTGPAVGEPVVLLREPPGAGGTGALRVMDLAVSPSGDALAALVAGRLPEQGGRVVVIDLARPGTAARTVAEEPVGVGVTLVGWTRRHTILAMISKYKGPDPQLIEIDPRGGRRSIADEPGLVVETARLDPGRDRLIATVIDHGAATVQEIAVTGGARRTLVPNDVEGVTFGGYALASDGWLIYTRRENNANVWLFDFRERSTQSPIQR